MSALGIPPPPSLPLFIAHTSLFVFYCVAAGKMSTFFMKVDEDTNELLDAEQSHSGNRLIAARSSVSQTQVELEQVKEEEEEE